VKIVYIPIAALTVQTNGTGIISPNNYNGAMLQIGQNYSLTAHGMNGWVFTNWSSCTNGTLTIYTNNPAAAFVMCGNLVMQANFVDTNLPAFKITNAVTGMLLTNSMFTVMGVATDDQEVASVKYSLDGAAWTPATTADNWAGWSAALSLEWGTNTLAVYAVATNGNISATDSVNIVREAVVTTFPIATSDNIRHPQAQLAFDGSNYLVAFQVYPPGQTNNPTAAAQFVSQSGALVGGLLALNPDGSDDPPCLAFDGTNYLAAWADYSDTNGTVPVRGAFVSPAGEVSSAITLTRSTTVDSFGTIVYGGGLYFLMWSDNRTATNSIYGALVSPAGTVAVSDFQISANGQEEEAGQGAAAFDGTNFLAVWSSASGNTCIGAQLIDTAGNLVGGPIVIYTNSAPASMGLPCVAFDGTKYLVLFNVGLESASTSSPHIVGSFVTTAGQVLTNQITLPGQTGPQIIPAAAFDGVNYLVSWDQGFNPFSTPNTSSTIFGRFFDVNGEPASAQFPLFTTQGAQTPFWAPVLFDGSQFVLVGGLGKQIGAAPNNLEFTNGVIYGAFVSP